MRTRRYTKELLEGFVRDSFTFAEVIRKLGKTPTGSTQALITKRIREYGFDTSHFMGERRNCGPGHKGGCEKKHWSKVLVMRNEDDRELSWRLRRALLESGREYRCEGDGCVVKGEWLGKPLILHVDHISGNWGDCRPENVRFLCPNCHDQTDGHSNRRGGTSITAPIPKSKRNLNRKAGVPEWHRGHVEGVVG